MLPLLKRSVKELSSMSIRSKGYRPSKNNKTQAVNSVISQKVRLQQNLKVKLARRKYTNHIYRIGRRPQVSSEAILDFTCVTGRKPHPSTLQLGNTRISQAKPTRKGKTSSFKGDVEFYLSFMALDFKTDTVKPRPLF
jgi:hypothetical protein